MKTVRCRRPPRASLQEASLEEASLEEASLGEASLGEASLQSTGLQQLLLSGDDQTSGTRTKLPPQPHTTCWFGFNVRNPLNLLWTAVASRQNRHPSSSACSVVSPSLIIFQGLIFVSRSYFPFLYMASCYSLK